MRIIRFILLISLFVMVSGCALNNGDDPRGASSEQTRTENEKNEDNSVEIKTDLKELEKYIQLPYKPIRAQYATEKLGAKSSNERDELVPGPSEYAITVFLQYDAKTIEEIKKKVLNTKPVIKSFKISNRMIEQWYSKEMQKQIKANNKVIVKDWYSDELKKKIKEDKKTGYIFTGNYYPPDLFAKKPFEKGYLYFAPENTILLYFNTGM